MMATRSMEMDALMTALLKLDTNEMQVVPAFEPNCEEMAGLMEQKNAMI